MLKKQRYICHEGVQSDYTNCQVAFFGIPFDGTVSNRPGTRFAPQMIRTELDGLETYSPYLDKDLTDYQICDLGDLDLPFGNTKKVLNIIEEEVTSILEDNKKVLALGGEHLVSYPIIKAYAKKYKDLHIIHLDAHADLREDYLGETLSHATVMRRVFEVIEEGHLWQMGIRSGTKKEFEFAANHTNMYKFTLDRFEDVIKTIGNKPIYLSLDLDVLDPSILSGTGTPEPGGVNFQQLMNSIQSLMGLNVVGCDIVELAPNYDNSGVSTVVACKLLRELILILSNGLAK